MKRLFISATVTTFFVVSVQAQATYVGNYGSVAGLANVAPGGGVDEDPPLVILGEYNSSGPSGTSTVTLPSGVIQDVDFYGAGAYDFTVYALTPGTAGPGANEELFTVVASETFSGTAATQGIVTLSTSPGFNVNSGDLLAFAGIGPWYPQSPNDANGSDATYGNSGSFTATPPGGAGTTFTVGLNGDTSATYEYISDFFGNQGRTYAFGVDVSAVPEPSTFISGALLLLPLAGGAFRLARRALGKSDDADF